MDTSTGEGETSRTSPSTPTHSLRQQSLQWYETDQGGQLFAAIHTEVKKKFANVEISRVTSTKAISIVIWVNNLQSLKVHFPSTFPQEAVTVELNDSRKEITVPYNKNKKTREFAQEFCQMLGGLTS